MKIRIDLKPLVRLMFLLSVVAVAMIQQSCVKQDADIDIASRGGSGDVWINVGVGEAPNSEERIRTMRVIVVSVADNKVIVNHYDPDPAGKTVRLMNQPKGIRLRFYIVCNEASLPQKTQMDLENFSKDSDASSLAGYIVLDQDENPENRSFPHRFEDITEHGVPITGISKEVELIEEETILTIPVTFMVVKIQLDVTNNRSDEIHLENGGGTGLVSDTEPGFCADRAFLFPQSNGLIVPDQTNYIHTPTYYFSEKGQSYIALAPAEKRSKLLTLYVYPTSKGAGYYMFVWGNMGGLFEGPFYKGTDLTRGMYIIANVGLGINSSSDWQYSVEEWEPVSVEVPPFD